MKSAVSHGRSQFWVRAKWWQSASASAGQTHGRLEDLTMWSGHQDKLLHMKHRAGFGFGFSPKNDVTGESEAQCCTPARPESQQNYSLRLFHLLQVTGQFFSISSETLPTLNASSLFCCSAFRLIPRDCRRAVAYQSRHIPPPLQPRFYSQTVLKFFVNLV